MSPASPPDGLTAAERLHYQLLDQWRAAMDLVGPGPLAPHFVDAAAAVDALGSVQGRWADLGSGAGFPGVALAARNPDADVVLVESRRKRAVFLDTVVDGARRAGVGLTHATVFHGRSERFDGPLSGIVSRAYKAPEAVVADADRLLCPDGRLLIMLGDSDWDPPDGWVVQNRARYALGDGWRRVVVLRRAVASRLIPA